MMAKADVALVVPRAMRERGREPGVGGGADVACGAGAVCADCLQHPFAAVSIPQD